MIKFQAREPRIVMWDLEIIPDFEEVMRTGAWTGLGAYPGLTLKASITSTICFGWKVVGKGRGAECINAWDFPKRWKRDVNDDYELVKAGREILANADAMITHNGKRFDFPYFQTRLKANKLNLLPYNLIHIDLCQVSAKGLYLFNNRHNTVSDFLQGAKKMDTGGWDLWYDVWHRKEAAQRKMSKYCKKDVTLLETNFEELRPIIKNLPNFNHWREDGKPVCSNCGSPRIKSNGLRPTKTKVHRQYVCLDCGSFMTIPIDKIPRAI